MRTSMRSMAGSAAGITIAVVIALLIGIIGIEAQTETQPQARLREYVAKAKARGLSVVDVPSPLPTYAEVRSVAEALRYYTLVTAEYVDSRSVPSKDEYQIFTLNKFRIIENLSAKTLPASGEVPRGAEALLPVGTNEFLLRVAGGETQLDGVTIKSEGDTPTFSTARQYLLFLAFRPGQGGIATLEIGPAGAYAIESDRITAVAARSMLAKDLKLSYANSLSKLKSSLH